MRLRIFAVLVCMLGLTVRAESAPRSTAPRPAHGDYAGCVLHQDGIDVVLVWEGVVTGALTVPYAHLTTPVTASFLHTDSTRFTPDSPNTLWLTIADSTTVYPVNVAGWTFQLDGLKVGTTTLKVRVLNVTHFDFTSSLIAVNSQVVAGIAPPAAARDEFVARRDGGTVVCTFAMARAGQVRLEAFDARGRRVARIADVEVDAGQHRVQWTPDEAARGVRFLRLTETSGVRTARVVVGQ